MGSGQSDQITIEPLFFPSKENEQKFIQFISQAKQYIRICIYTFTNKNIVDKIVQIIKENPNLKVQVIADDAQTNLPSQKSILDQIILEGKGQVEVKLDNSTYSLMHNKYIVIDTDYIATGSFNWTKAAVYSNKENLLLIKSKKLVQQFDENFQSLWKDFQFMNDRIKEQKQQQIDKAEKQKLKDKKRAEKALQKPQQQFQQEKNDSIILVETGSKFKQVPKRLKRSRLQKKQKIPKKPKSLKNHKEPDPIKKNINKVTVNMMDDVKKVFQWVKNFPQRIFCRS